MTLSELTQVFGWATLLNLVFLLIIGVRYLWLRRSTMKLQRKFLRLPQSELTDSELNAIYIRSAANYELLTLAFMLMPYIALKIIGG